MDHLKPVLWANRTTPSRATGETPFFLVFGAEAVLPPEVINGSPRVNAFDEERQEHLQKVDLDLLEEKCLVAALRAAKYQQALRRYHQSRVKPRLLVVGDVVLKRILSRVGMNKLSPT